MEPDAGKLSCLYQAGLPGDFPGALEVFSAPGFQFCKDRPKIRAGVWKNLFIKSYNYNSFWSRFRHRFRISRAKVCWKAAEFLRKNGIPTPEVCGWFRESGLWLPQRDILICEALPQSCRFADRIFLDSPEEIREKLVDLAAKLHELGVEHGDLNLRNIYLDDAGKAGVIDLDGFVLHSAPLEAELRGLDLARLASSAAKLYPEKERDVEGMTRQFCESYRKRTGVSLYSPRLLKESFRLAQRKWRSAEKH